MQTTIRHPVSCCGIGVHSGRKTQLTLIPASKPNTGIVFVRTDIKYVDNHVPALYSNVLDTALATSIVNDAKVKISTIEHLMAALQGCGIDNLIVEVDGPEIPIMDGSSKPFVFMTEYAGIKYFDVKKKRLKLLKDINITDKDCEIHAIPSDNAIIDLTIDYPSAAIGRQQMTFSDISKFNQEIAPSRTFGFLQDFDYMQSKGLAKGASLDNAIGIDKDVILNHEGLRYKDEFVRHKMLDLFGDLYTTGGEIIANINGYKTSHYLNNQFLRKLFADPYSYSWE